THTLNYVAAGLNVTYQFQDPVSLANGNSFCADVYANESLPSARNSGATVVAPYEVQMTVGQTFAFRADAWDQLGNRVPLSPTWSANGGGSIDSTGAFVATTVG